MVRVMYDSVNPSAIPSNAEIVAGYIDGNYAWPAMAWERFPTAIQVHIAVFPATNDGIVLDCEPGDATPTQCPEWVLMRRAAGTNPTVYCSYDTWPTVQAAFSSAGVAPPQWWIAGYPDPIDNSGNPIIPAGAIAHQWTDTGSYDASIVADYWPGVDPLIEEYDMPASPVLFLASAVVGVNNGNPLYPFGVWRNEFGVYVGLQSTIEQENLLKAFAGTPQVWLEQATLAEFVRISRVGVDAPEPLTANVTGTITQAAAMTVSSVREVENLPDA